MASTCSTGCKGDKQVDLMIFDRDLPEFDNQPVDQKLVLLAKHLDGKVVTNDFNLNKVAKVQNVGVVNLNELANALKPVFLPGEEVTVRVMKPGEESHQGVGYLEDGTMVVIENGREHLGEQVVGTGDQRACKPTRGGWSSRSYERTDVESRAA